MKNIKSYLPIFPGFYNTIFEPCEENEIEYYQSEYGKHIKYDDITFFYEDYQNDVALYCCDWVENELNFYLQTNIKINFESIYSPKYYNFSNDSINCEYVILDEDLHKIFMFLVENINSFKEYLEDNFKSRDGFISFYSYNAKDWLNEYWLEIEDKTLIIGAILDFILNELIEEPIYDMYYHCQDHVCLTSELKTEI